MRGSSGGRCGSGGLGSPGRHDRAERQRLELRLRWSALGAVMGASADERQNIWVAGRANGIFVQRGGTSGFQQFTLADGCIRMGIWTMAHPPTPTRASAKRRPSASPVAPARALTSGTPERAIAKMNGTSSAHEADHALADPSIYKSGDADRVVLERQRHQRRHYDISSGRTWFPASRSAARSCATVFRVVWQRGSKRNAADRTIMGSSGSARTNGRHGPRGLYGKPHLQGPTRLLGNAEHVHPALNDARAGFLTATITASP